MLKPKVTKKVLWCLSYKNLDRAGGTFETEREAILAGIELEIRVLLKGMAVTKGHWVKVDNNRVSVDEMVRFLNRHKNLIKAYFSAKENAVLGEKSQFDNYI